MKSTTYGVVAVVVLAVLMAGFAWSLSPRSTSDSVLDDESGIDGGGVYDPYAAGEDIPVGFRQLLGRDDIPPVYDPIFVEAAGVDWDDDTLVIGLAIDGDARAYPVSFLNFREMVVDRVAGIPVLVTW